ncbi:hypothetical protein PHYBLDRAFT_171351 [Phycomyces blakesleeanus NRRL 1555(-)]|uniref:Uncharacterized protein n=1 Tax=Phycomyces blakesleeanus (strain ATCC 8743b / DSM 1359 / FGSC 10004 / NBRC 33097 / NRRL 1555) TaxID=763407 RepID=A0A162WRW0_PHYB8|nr:hypothetical protein PHYBLDRAFT_171351 [Phycomyces blakesleeanus NRRL 1555(-)]OAD70605.1 hypothetical protein PHYBLDRAFT_171351 [Phycomyces blakesleeanus NRRL 1555(-)]|eukprot:XP_018288645.1 hypothetical protein PHYBLDRAFT_171351 [Phycomyces blakesleeanus NRRL 1555(-)]
MFLMEKMGHKLQGLEKPAIKYFQMMEEMVPRVLGAAIAVAFKFSFFSVFKCFLTNSVKRNSSAVVAFPTALKKTTVSDSRSNEVALIMTYKCVYKCSQDDSSELFLIPPAQILH